MQTFTEQPTTKEHVMIQFSPWQYLMIDVANHFGHDKLLFEERIEWAQSNLKDLEAMTDQAETKPLYVKAVQAVRKVQNGEVTGHIMGLDASCSGIQVMSAMTGCVAGATNTGLVNPSLRADAYSTCTDEMNTILGGTLEVPRRDAKAALMTTMYGSKKTPKDIFGDKTPALEAFYQAAQIVAPGAWQLLQELLASWQPYALVHEWKLPDGFDARVKVMEKQEARIEVDELDHATFTYEYYENVGSKRGLSNAANVVHSVDAYVLRCIHRRCNYNPLILHFAHEAIMFELDQRANTNQTSIAVDGKIQGTQFHYYIQQYERSGMADVVILPELLGEDAVWYLSTKHLEALDRICRRMKEHAPFEVITIHDEFKCSPVNMNHLRQHYIDVFAEIADSRILEDILSQIHGMPGSYTKLSNNLSTLIRGSNYGLC